MVQLQQPVCTRVTRFGTHPAQHKQCPKRGGENSTCTFALQSSAENRGLPVLPVRNSRLARKFARPTRAAVSPSPFHSRLRITGTPLICKRMRAIEGRRMCGAPGPMREARSRNRGIPVPLYTSSRVKLPRPSLLLVSRARQPKRRRS